MQTAPSETQRQRSLDTYHIVDSLPEAAYDDITRLASMLCGAPVALVSLIDRDRQWFKSRAGFGPSETPREYAVCDHAIREPGRLFEVPDFQRDARFADNPLLRAEGLRFYAGMPLRTPSGTAVGTVCVLDHVPRELTPEQRDALASLARLTMNLMEGRRREHEHEVAAVIAPSPPRTAEAESAICLIELQQYADVASRIGERAVERLLSNLDMDISAGLAGGDSVDRVTGSAELVVALHGAGIGSAIERIERIVAQTGAEHGVALLFACARAEPGDASTAAVYLRAEAKLSEAKDAHRASLQGA